jgi:hypothetical protein
VSSVTIHQIEPLFIISETKLGTPHIRENGGHPHICGLKETSRREFGAISFLGVVNRYNTEDEVQRIKVAASAQLQA